MGGIGSLLNTLQQGLQAQQAALNVTGENITNVSTPGYVKRTVDIQTQVDGGVNVTQIQRSFNQFTYAQVLVAHGQQGSADARSSALNDAQAVVAPSSGSTIGDSINSFFSSVNALAASPSDPSARAAVLAQATQVAQSFSTTAQGLQGIQSSLFTQAQGVVGQVNQDLTQIAQLNGQIAQAQAGDGGGAPDLEDQRDQLVQDVSDKIGAKVVTDSTGSMTLFAGGAALISGTNASTLSVSLDGTGALQFTATSAGGMASNITSGVTDGTLGGIREARDTDVAQTMNQLDQLAYDFSNQVNAVQSSGYGLDGNTGRNMFVAPTQVQGAAAAMAVDPAIAGQPSFIGAAANAQDVPGGNDVAVTLAQLANQNLGSGGTPTARFGAIAAQLGSATSAASNDATTRADMVTQAENMNSSASGVSLNEEMVNLTQYQQAFQAATRVLQVADSLLSDFITQMGQVSG